MPSIEYNEDQYNEFVYNSGTLVYLPSELQPEDARSVIADLYPTRVNWVANFPAETASIAIADGKIYFIDPAKRIHCLDAANGKEAPELLGKLIRKHCR